MKLLTIFITLMATLLLGCNHEMVGKKVYFVVFDTDEDELSLKEYELTFVTNKTVAVKNTFLSDGETYKHVHNDSIFATNLEYLPYDYDKGFATVPALETNDPYLIDPEWQMLSFSIADELNSGEADRIITNCVKDDALREKFLQLLHNKYHRPHDNSIRIKVKIKS